MASSFGKEAPKLLATGHINGGSSVRTIVPKADLDPAVRANVVASLRGSDWVAARLSDTAGNAVFDAALTLAYALPAGEWLTASQLAHLLDNWYQRRSVRTPPAA